MTSPIRKSAEALRNKILAAVPDGSIVPKHDAHGHHYQVLTFPDQPIYDSVTTKLKFVDKGYLVPWAVNQAIEYIRDNWARVHVSEFDRECVFEEAKIAHENTRDDAGDIGTRSHAIIENWLNDWIATGTRGNITAFIPTGESDPRVLSAISSAEKFCIDYNVMPVVPELLVASRRFKVAGTLDLLALVGEVVAEGDPKCQHEMWSVGSKGAKEECTKCGRKLQYELAVVDWKTSNTINKSEYVMQTSAYWECLKEMAGLKPKTIYVVRLNKTYPMYECQTIDSRIRKAAIKAFVNLSESYDAISGGFLKSQPTPKKILTI